MVVQFKNIADIIDEKYPKEVILNYIKELILAIEKTKESLYKDNKSIKLIRSETLLTQVVVDAVEDLKRIHDFQPIDNANAIKEAAYFGFWLIKRKPIQIQGDLDKVCGTTKDETDRRKINFLFINEFCAAVYMLPKVFRLSEEVQDLNRAYPNIDKISNDWKNYFDNLIYFLAYRAESPKAIEEALTSLIMIPKWHTNFDFWKVDEKI